MTVEIYGWEQAWKAFAAYVHVAPLTYKMEDALRAALGAAHGELRNELETARRQIRETVELLGLEEGPDAGAYEDGHASLKDAVWCALNPINKKRESPVPTKEWLEARLQEHGVLNSSQRHDIAKWIQDIFREHETPPLDAEVHRDAAEKYREERNALQARLDDLGERYDKAWHALARLGELSTVADVANAAELALKK